MGFFAAVESDLARRIRRGLGGLRRMGTKFRVVAAILVCLMAAVTLPYSGIAQTRDGVDWETVKKTPPEEWSEELKAQIAAAGHDVEAIAERVRLGQAETRDKEGSDLEAIGRRIRAAVASGALTAEEGRKKMEEARRRMSGEPSREERIWKAAMATDPDEWSDRLKTAILELRPGSTIEEIAVAVRQRQLWGKAMAIPPQDWSDELKAAITAAGLDPEAVAERVRQAKKEDGESKGQTELQIEANTAVEESSWGRIKKENRDPK